MKYLLHWYLNSYLRKFIFIPAKEIVSKPHKCNFCGKRFKQAQVLKRHIKSTHVFEENDENMQNVLEPEVKIKMEPGFYTEEPDPDDEPFDEEDEENEGKIYKEAKIRYGFTKNFSNNKLWSQIFLSKNFIKKFR